MTKTEQIALITEILAKPDNRSWRWQKELNWLEAERRRLVAELAAMSK
jgi:hypothetical protein